MPSIRYQLKFVIDTPADCSEVEAYLGEFPEIDRGRVLLMPQGIDAASLAERTVWLEPLLPIARLSLLPAAADRMVRLQSRNVSDRAAQSHPDRDGRRSPAVETEGRHRRLMSWNPTEFHDRHLERHGLTADGDVGSVIRGRLRQPSSNGTTAAATASSGSAKEKRFRYTRGTMNETSANASSSPAASGPGKGSLLVIFLTVFIDLLGFGMVLPLLPVYAQDFVVDQNGFLIGMLMASFSAMQFLWAPVWGRLSDRIGRRPVLMIGLAGSVVFYALFGMATVWRSVFWLFVARIGAGIAGANIPITQAYIADTTTLENRTKGMALIGAAFGLGFTFGPLLGSLAIPSGTGVAGAVARLCRSMSIGGGAGLGMVPVAGIAAAGQHQRRAADVRHDGPARRARDAIGRPAVAHIVHSRLGVRQLRNHLGPAAQGQRGSAGGERITKRAPLRSLARAAPPSGSEVVAASPFDFTFREVLYTFAYIGVTLSIAQGVVVRRMSGVVPEALMASVGAVLEISGFGVMIVAVDSGSRLELFVALSVIVFGFAFMMPSLTSLISRRSDPAKQGGILGLSQSVSAVRGFSAR